jgi:hypothetical protein
MTYSQRYILFADIIGFSKYIASTVDDNRAVELKLRSFANLILFLKGEFAIPIEDDTEKELSVKASKRDQYLKNVSVTQFSDSFIISRETDSSNIKELLLDACFIWLWGTYFGFLFRGAITFGEIIHTNDFVFGPGFIRAYNLEREKAKYPRIIIDNDIIDNFLANDKYTPLVKKDADDGLYYIDTFSGMDFLHRNTKSTELRLKNIHKLILDGLEIDDESIKRKYIWLQDKIIQYENKLSKM